MGRNKLVDEEVRQIGRDVSNNQGGLVLSLRHFTRGGEITGDALPPRIHHSYLFEAGILSGNLSVAKTHGGVRTSPWGLPSPGEVIRRGDDSYAHRSDFIIPVRRKLSKIVQPFSGKLYDLGSLNIRDLRDITDGEVSMSLREIGLLVSSRGAGRIEGDMSPLEEFKLLIGDEKVRSYFEEIGSWEEWEGYIRDSATVQLEINKHYAEKERSVAKNLVMIASEVNAENEAIKVVEPDVLSVSGDYWKEQDGEDFRWTAPDAVFDYLGHRACLRSSLHELDQIRGPFPAWIDTSPGGVPGQIERGKYLSWINHELVPDAIERMARIDSHLENEEEAAYTRAYGPSQ